VQCIKNL